MFHFRFTVNSSKELLDSIEEIKSRLGECASCLFSCAYGTHAELFSLFLI